MRHLHNRCGHKLDDIGVCPDGGDVAVCACGWRSPVLPDARAAVDWWRTHHLTVTGEQAPT